ncbi:hypothetical protein KIW84_032039 [Lathyrus oleraceus]|uniref:Uncharacterized protein n=1 Tax=Pisum sativum TaxID=3888 RepID=A0A9D5AW39_PEA|nr:hypothetical protein KIW84_032039 [Pisum sativum]
MSEVVIPSKKDIRGSQNRTRKTSRARDRTIHLRKRSFGIVREVVQEIFWRSAAARFFSLLEVRRRNRTTILCTAAAKHENHLILSSSASIRAAAVAPAAMSESDNSEHSAADTHKSAADTHKSADTGDSGQSKNTTFRGSKSEFHPALSISNIRNHIPIILEMEKDQYGT